MNSNPVVLSKDAEADFRAPIIAFRHWSEQMWAEAKKDEADQRLYRKMKTTQGGVMLLVRLHADLAESSVETLRGLRMIDVEPVPADVFEKGSRLRSTYEWLEDQFGRPAAIRAVIEVAGEVLRLMPIN